MSRDSIDNRMTWLLNQCRELLATRELEPLLETATNTFLKLTGGIRGFVLLKDRDTGFLRQHVAKAASSDAVGDDDKQVQRVAERVLKDKQSRFSTFNVPAQGNIPAKRVMVVCVPLLHENEAIGALYSDGPAPAEEEDQDVSQQLCEAFGRIVATTIENARIFERATNDPLTGLPNGNYFLLQLGKTMRHASDRTPTGILLVDLDAFKRLNTQAGTDVGDHALADIATTLRDVMRADGLVARYDSDTFAILLPPEDEHTIALRLRDAAERARAAVGTKVYHGIRMSACIAGLAFPGPKAKDAQALLALADDVLARAQARGPGEVEVDQSAP